MNPFSLLSPGYALLAKVITGIVLVIALWWAWHHYVANPYINAGKAEVQADWDAQKKVDAEMKTSAITAARAEERKAIEAQAAIDQQHLKDKTNENIALNTQLNAVRSDNRQLRRFTGTIEEPGTGSRTTGAGASSGNATCSFQLPSTIDEGIRRFEETVLRIGSEANDTADQLRAAQAVIVQDRLTCNR